MKALDIVVPVYNEEHHLVCETISRLKDLFKSREGVTIIVVDDGSAPEFGLDRVSDIDGIVFLRHATNRGYGSALKTGIRAGEAPLIAITDADGTYPVENLPALVDAMDSADMVIGARVGQIRKIPWLRRFPKSVLNTLASYMSGMRVRDLNSGLRVFTRPLCLQLWEFFPRRFSFTSTLTMGAHLGGYDVVEMPIDYFARVGSSSIQPIRDTLRFLNIILRMGILFHPLKLFIPVASLLAFAGVAKAIKDIIVVAHIGNLAVMVLLAALQIALMGYLGELIVTSRMLGRRDE